MGGVSFAFLKYEVTHILATTKIFILVNEYVIRNSFQNVSK
jgi:hypothetical protein